MLPAIQETRLLNFIVIGEVRSGTSIVQSSLCNRAGVICHANLMHPEEKIRKSAHEAYFGLSKNSCDVPEWFVEQEISPWQYINHTILDNPKRGETAIGFRLMYPEIHKWELFDLFEMRCREGDFCLIHLLRNPIACFVSLKQAQRSGIWSCDLKDTYELRCPGPIFINPDELVSFCRTHLSIRSKIRASCNDCLEISYRDLFINYQSIMYKVFDFLELPENEEPAVPSCRRLRNRLLRKRITNLDNVWKDLPSDIQQLFNAEDLF